MPCASSRAISEAVRPVVERYGIEEIAFVGARPFYGLTMYLRVRVESLGIGPSRELATHHFTAQTVCQEIAERERNVYALKRSRAAEFVATVRAGGNLAAREVGVFEADDNKFALFIVDSHG